MFLISFQRNESLTLSCPPPSHSSTISKTIELEKQEFFFKLDIGLLCTNIDLNIQKIKERIIFQKFLRIKKVLYKKFVHYITPSRAKILQLFCQQRKIKIICNFFCLFLLLLCIIWDLSNYFSMKLEIPVLHNWKFFLTNHYINEKFYNFNRIKQDYQDIII